LRSKITFYKRDDAGKQLSRLSFDELTHSFYFGIDRVDAEGRHPEEAGDLLELNRDRWKSDGRFTLRAYQAAIDSRPGLECIRAVAQYEERDNPKFPGVVLMIDNIDYLCLDPGSPDDPIEFKSSERYLVNRRPRHPMIDRLRPDFEAMLRSFSIGSPQSAEAAERFRLAAERGSSQAAFGLGVWFSDQRAFAEAAKWYRRAGETGSLAAQHKLGVLLFEGVGVARDRLEAIRWLKLSANQGYAASHAALGRAYAEDHAQGRGHGIEAYFHFSVALALFPSGEVRARVAQERDLLAKALTSEEVRVATNRAEAWKQK
jgi:hypothetical protein